MGTMIRVCAVLLVLASFTEAADVQRWQIKESLGHTWENELVVFPLTAAKAAPGDEAKYSVVDETGKAQPFQFWVRDKTPCVVLLVDLAPYSQRAFTLTDAPQRAAGRGDVSVTEEERCYVLAAGRTAVQIPRLGDSWKRASWRSVPAPIQSVKGVSGRWLGKGALCGWGSLDEATTVIDARGPLFAQATIRYTSGPIQGPIRMAHHARLSAMERGRVFRKAGDEPPPKPRSYQLCVRVVSGEDVVLVEEDSSLSAPELAQAIFVMPPDLAPPVGQPSTLSDWLIYKGMGWEDVVIDTQNNPVFQFSFFENWEANRATKYDLAGGNVLNPKVLAVAAKDWRLGLVLTPYQGRGYRTVATVFDAEGSKDLLGVFSRNLSRWVHVNENRVPMPWLADGVTAHFIAFQGRREWGLFVAPGGPGREDTSGKHGASKHGAIRRAQVKHGETPLDKVKDWTLEWDVPADAHFPRVFTSREDVTRLKQSLASLSADAKNAVQADLALQALLTGDDAGLKKAFEDGVASLRASVTAFLLGGHNTMDSYTHRFQEIVRYAALQADMGLASKSLTADERKRGLAVVAFLAYKLSDPDYWPYHAYGGGPSNPNMMSIATNALAMCAALCAGHPKQKEWLKLCERLVCADILMSIGPKGAWLESPGYQGAGNTPINMTALILRNAGVVDLARHPDFGKRLLSVSTYCANLLTPPDPRFQGKRMPMALGDNVPFFNEMYAYLAYSGREAFPTQAGNAIWCWEQMGRPTHTALILLNEHVLDGAIKPVPISGKTEAFPGFGLMMRHGFGTKHETFLTFRQNRFSYGHYDEDQGSFSLFAKGAPLCLDWIDYSPGEAKYHNSIDYHPAVVPWLVPEPKFVFHDEAEYVEAWQASGVKDGAPVTPPDAKPEWVRQMLFVKDTTDPGDATYLVFRDRVDTDRPSEWNCWTLARKGSERIDGPVAQLEGQFDVDLALFFYRKPDKPLASEFLHHQTKSYITMDQDQTCIRASSAKGGDYGVVLYPLRRGVDKAPTVKELASGAVELTWPGGRRHLIFLFPETREAKEGGVTFRGKAGVVKFDRGKRTVAVLEGALGE